MNTKEETLDSSQSQPHNKFTSESETISQSTLIFAEELASIFYKESVKK